MCFRSVFSWLCKDSCSTRTAVILGVLLPVLLVTLAAGYSLRLPTAYLPLLLSGYPPPTPTPSPGRVLISEVLYQPSGSEPEEEWVELYNAGGLPLGLTGYKIGDEETRDGLEGMYQFPAGAVINPGQVLVIANRAADFEARFGFLPDYELQQSIYAVPVLAKYSDWSNGGMNLANTGDEVLLLDEQDELVDGVSWGSSSVMLSPAVMLAPRGASLERYPAYRDRDLADDWRARPAPSPGQVEIPPPTPTPTLTPVPTFTYTPVTPSTTPSGSSTPEPLPLEGSLLISEVLVNPKDNDPLGQWFELINAGSSSLDLSQFKVGDEETQGGTEGMYSFPPGTVLPAGGVLVAAYKAETFLIVNKFLPDFEWFDSRPDVPDLIPYLPWSTGFTNLSNLGDELLILDGDGKLVDALSWGSSTWAFNPSVPSPTEGFSLERCPSTRDADLASDWQAQSLPNPGEAICQAAR
jgi:hypothetical protein